MNRVNVQITKFTNLGDNGQAEDTTYGYRIYDDEGHAYNNNYQTHGEVIKDVRPETLVRFLQTTHPDFFESVVHQGVHLNGAWYAWAEIKPEDWNDEDEGYQAAD